jgi:hypothetical protein
MPRSVLLLSSGVSVCAASAAWLGLSRHSKSVAQVARPRKTASRNMASSGGPVHQRSRRSDRQGGKEPPPRGARKRPERRR